MRTIAALTLIAMTIAVPVTTKSVQHYHFHYGEDEESHYLKNNHKVMSLDTIRNSFGLRHLTSKNHKVMSLDTIRNSFGLRNLNPKNHKVMSLDTIRNSFGLRHLNAVKHNLRSSWNERGNIWGHRLRLNGGKHNAIRIVPSKTEQSNA